jgi:hypothetical protein
VPGERGEQHAAGAHLGAEALLDGRRIGVERCPDGLRRFGHAGLGRDLAGQGPGAQREADPLASPRLEQARGVPGDDDPSRSQGGTRRTTPGQVPGVPDHRVPGQAEAVGELAQVIAGGVTLLGARPGTGAGAGPGRDDADGEAVALGEDPPVGRWDPSPVQEDAPGPLPLPGRGGGDLQLQAEVDLLEGDTDVPAGDPGGAVGANDHAGGDGGAVGEPRVRVAGLLADRADGGLLADPRAGGQCPVQQRGVELLAHDHGQQWPGVRAGEFAAAAQREGGGGDLVTGGQTGQVFHGGQRGPDQAAAAGLVPGMLGAFQDERPRPGGGGRARGRQPGRAAPDDRDIPLSLPLHASKGTGPRAG